MIPSKGYKLRPIEVIANKNGHEEFYYTEELIDEGENVIVDAMTLRKIKELFNEHFILYGRILGSKSRYRDAHPNNFTIFNANICIKQGKVWFGDVDLTLEKDILLKISKEVGQTLYVLYEMDARFNHEEEPLLSKSACIFRPDGTFEIREDLRQFYTL